VIAAPDGKAALPMRALAAITAIILGSCRSPEVEPEFVRPVVRSSHPLTLKNPQQERVTWPIWGSAFDLAGVTRARIALDPSGESGVVFGSPDESHAFALLWDGAWTLRETVDDEPVNEVSLAIPQAARVAVEVAEGASAIRVFDGERLAGSLSSTRRHTGAMGIYVQLEPQATLLLGDLTLSTPLVGPRLDGPSLDALAGAHGRSFGSTNETGTYPPRHDLAFEAMHGSQFGVAGILDFYWTTTRGEDEDYFFLPADLAVNYATVNGQAIHGYFLVWDEELPAWITAGGPIDAILDEHIGTLVGRYRGRVNSWIVANEAFLGPDENGTDEAGYAESVWYDALGPDYIARAFRTARAHDPATTLLYNETGAEAEGPKSDFMYARLAELVRDGVPIDGVGLQFHIDAAAPPDFASVERNLRRLAALGLDVYITELDVSLSNYRGTQEDRFATQARLFATVVETCLAVSACKAITTFGFSDKHAWDELGTSSDPLLFTRDYEAKPAYHSVRAALSR
jgi:GH35 family endo-1,4-beta-xylanase